MKIREMNISARTKACLLKAGYLDLEDLKSVSIESLQEIRNFNQSCLDEILPYIESLSVDINTETTDSTEQTSCDTELQIRASDTEVVIPDSIPNLMQRNIRVLQLSMRTMDCLHRMGVYTIEDLCSLSETELKQNRNLGLGNRLEIVHSLAERGLSLKK